MDHAIANAMRIAGLELEDAVSMATTNPAALLGVEPEGSIHFSFNDGQICILETSPMRLSNRCYAVTGLAYQLPWVVNAGFIVGDEETLIVDTGANAPPPRPSMVTPKPRAP